jgi:hypothetical protein
MEHKRLSIPLDGKVQKIRQSQTSKVERFEGKNRAYFLKTYTYPLPKGPFRGVFRNTLFAPSRAAREWRALKHLAAHGVQPDLALWWEERRRLGLLLEARLLSLDFQGPDLSSPQGRKMLETHGDRGLQALKTFVDTLHDSGLRDPDFYLRNFLVRENQGGLQFAKIDSSSSWLLPPGPSRDPARSKDRDTLSSELRAAGFTP